MSSQTNQEGSTQSEPTSPTIPRKRKYYHQARSQSCCRQIFEILRGIQGVDTTKLHKPKLPPKVKLSQFCNTLPIKDSITPQLVHILRRFFEGQKPGNVFENEIFTYLQSLDSKNINALRFGLKGYDEIPAAKQHCLFREDLLNWPIDKPVDASNLAKDWVNEAVFLAMDTLYNQTTCDPGKARPWEREVPGDPDNPQSKKVKAPWPWINSVNGLRTRSHRQPLDIYLPKEYLRECNFTIDENTHEIKEDCHDALWPNCEIDDYNITFNDKCLRIPEGRVGQLANLVGFNYFSKNCKVILEHIEKPYKYILDASVCGDTKTPIYQQDGLIIADHRVTDRLSFQIPDKTPDGLNEFVPGVYQIHLTVPNEINYNLDDGTKPGEFESNYAFLNVQPSQSLKYRIWVDKGHCYNETDGEWSSDEIYLMAIPATMSSVGDIPKFIPLPNTDTWTWDDADEGETLSDWNWRVLGSAGNPFSFNGILVIGMIGYEVDSEDALKEQVKSFGEAYLKYLGKVWELMAGVGGAGTLGTAISALKDISVKFAIIITGVVIAAILLVGLIWAGWAPADRMLYDVIVLSEQELFFLTHPKSPLPEEREMEMGTDHDVTLHIIPESKLDYLYVEERRYRSANEGSEYGLWFAYNREV